MVARSERSRSRPSSRTRATSPERRRYWTKKKCPFCVDKTQRIDYKNVNRLLSFFSERARMETRRRSGTCAKHQRRVSEAIKRARFLALLPYTFTQLRESGIILRG